MRFKLKFGISLYGVFLHHSWVDPYHFFPARPIEPGLAIIRPVRDVMVKAGETALFECHVIGPQDTDVDWLSDGKLIQPALLNCKMYFDGKRCMLLLNSVQDDSGTYTCKLSTAKGEQLWYWSTWFVLFTNTSLFYKSHYIKRGIMHYEEFLLFVKYISE